MAFSYIDPAQAMLDMTLEALGGLAPLAPPPRTPEVPTVTCELDQSWKEFEKELGILNVNSPRRSGTSASS